MWPYNAYEQEAIPPRPSMFYEQLQHQHPIVPQQPQPQPQPQPERRPESAPAPHHPGHMSSPAVAAPQAHPSPAAPAPMPVAAHVGGVQSAPPAAPHHTAQVSVILCRACRVSKARSVRRVMKDNGSVLETILLPPCCEISSREEHFLCASWGPSLPVTAKGERATLCLLFIVCARCPHLFDPRHRARRSTTLSRRCTRRLRHLSTCPSSTSPPRLLLSTTTTTTTIVVTTATIRIISNSSSMPRRRPPRPPRCSPWAATRATLRLRCRLCPRTRPTRSTLPAAAAQAHAARTRTRIRTASSASPTTATSTRSSRCVKLLPCEREHLAERQHRAVWQTSLVLL